MSDFIREVDDEYRRDRVVNFLTKYQVALIGLVVAIILGTAVYRIYLHYQNQAAETANARYDAAAALVREGKGAEGQAAFDKLQADGPGGYAMLSRLKAVEALALRDKAAAVRGYDAIAGDDGMEQTLRDTALIRGAILRVDSDDSKDFELRYTPYATEGFAYRSTLRELLALAAFKRNDTESAGRWLDQVVIDPNAPSSLRSRAEAFLGLVAAGPVGAAPEAVKPALELHPTATPAAPPAAATPAAPAATPQAAAPAAPVTPAPAPAKSAPAEAPPK
jgi:hypothetical protein